MPSESDLRAALRDRERRADAYGTPDFLAELARRQAQPSNIGRRRERFLAPVLVAAAVAAVALLVVSLVRSVPANRTTVSLPSHTPPSQASSQASSPMSSKSGASGRASSGAPATTPVAAPGTFPLRSYWFTLEPIPGVTVTGGTTEADLQQRTLDTTNGQGHYDLTVTAAGSWTPRRPANAIAVTVHGRPGFYGTLTELPMGVPARKPVGLAWQYAPRAWASVVSSDLPRVPRAIAQTIADAVRLAVPGRLLVPVNVGALPPPYSLQEVSTGIGGYRAGQSGVTGWESLIDFSRVGSQTDLSIEVNGPKPLAPSPSGSRTTINGRRAYISDTTVTIEGSDFECHLMVFNFTSVSPLNRSQLVALARTLSFPQQINNPAFWYDATTALP